MKVEYKDGFAVGFKMAVAECFRDSLAKKSFNTGDVIYDDRRAYAPWPEAMKHISLAFQVIGTVGDNIEYAVLHQKGGAERVLVKTKTIKEPVLTFIERLRAGH